MGETVWPKVGAVEVLRREAQQGPGQGLGEVFREAPEMGVQRESGAKPEKFSGFSLGQDPLGRQMFILS